MTHISHDDRTHIEKLLKWAADASRRGDHEASDRLYDAAHRVMNRAHYDAIGAHQG